MKIIFDLKHQVWEEHESYESWRARTDEHFKSRGAEYFMWYRLDALELLEHGGAVPGWLTDKGYSLLEDLQAWQVAFDADNPPESEANGES